MNRIFTSTFLLRTIQHLEHDDTKKTEERQKYARDIEQVKPWLGLEYLVQINDKS